MDKISILYIIDSFCDLAGAERNLFEIVMRLDKGKYNPTVYALWAGKGELIESLRQKGIRAKNLEMKKVYGFKALKEGIKLIQFIKKENIKIVVTYHESSDFWGGSIAKICGVPVIISSRRDMGYQLQKRHILFYKLINKYFDKIITVSNAVKNIVADRENVPCHKLITIHNGVDLEKFSKEVDKNTVKKSLGLDINRPVVGILATLRPIKGHRYFLQAASLVAKEFPDTYFLVVGWYENGPYFRELQNYTKKLQIDKNVIFTGGRSDTADILSIFDVSVFSSINEGFSNAVLESMAMAKPVVATNSGGTPEAVINGKTGVLVLPRESNKLAEAILTFLRDREKASRMGEEGKKRVETIFCIDNMVKNVETLYQDLLLEKEESFKIAIPLTARKIRNTSVKATKILLSNIFYYSGLITLIKKLGLKNKGIKILAFHRITNNTFDPLGMNLSVSNFEEAMKFIKRIYNPISLEQAVGLLQNHKDIPDKAIVITFDDGYRDNYTNAYPILKQCNIPATIFLSVEAIDKKKMLWFDIIVSAFLITTKQQVDLRKYNLPEYSLGSRYKEWFASQEVVSFAKTLPAKQKAGFINYILESLNVTLENMKGLTPMLEWEDIIDMKEAGISFGSHGMTHSILTNLLPEEIEYELVESKRIIKDRVGIDTTLFAYPQGSKGDYNEEIEKTLAQYGYLSACTLIKGSNYYNSSSLELKRFCINRGLASGITSHFSKSLFKFNIEIFRYK